MSTSNEGDYFESDYLTGSINNQSYLKTRNNDRIMTASSNHRPRTAISRHGGGNTSVRRTANNGTVISSKD